MEIVALILGILFVASVAALVGIVVAFRTSKTLLSAMLKTANRREARLLRQISEVEKKNVLLTDKVFVKSGYGSMQPVQPFIPSSDVKPMNRVTSPSEAISRQKKAEAHGVPPAVTRSFISEAEKIQAGAGNASSRNGAAGG